jgi:hypothetical protein
MKLLLIAFALTRNSSNFKMFNTQYDEKNNPRFVVSFLLYSC